MRLLCASASLFACCEWQLLVGMCAHSYRENDTFLYISSRFFCMYPRHTHTHNYKPRWFSIVVRIKTQWFLLSFRNAAPKMISILMATNHIKILFQRLLLSGTDRYRYILIQAKKSRQESKGIHSSRSKQATSALHKHNTTQHTHHIILHAKGHTITIMTEVGVVSISLYLFWRTEFSAANHCWCCCCCCYYYYYSFSSLSLFVNVIIVVDVSLFNHVPHVMRIWHPPSHPIHLAVCVLVIFCDKTRTERIASNQCQ